MRALRLKSLRASNWFALFAAACVFLVWALIIRPTLSGAIGSALLVAVMIVFGIATRDLTRLSKRMNAFRPYAPFCRDCGYDLRGIQRDRCPECDNPIPAHVTRRWSNAHLASQPSRMRFIETYQRFNKHKATGGFTVLLVVGAMLALATFMAAASMHFFGLGLGGNTLVFASIVIAIVAASAAVVLLARLRERAFS